MERLEIHPLETYPELIETCARWNFEEWGRASGWSLAETLAGLRRITEPDSGEEARIALFSDEPAGFVLLVDCDLSSHAHLKPWLASLYVAPAFRNRGIGRRLVASVEEIARDRGDNEVFLYTPTPAYYRPLGWRCFETLEPDGRSFEIMSKQLVTAQE